MAYDPTRGYHVLYGGVGSGDTTLTDTLHLWRHRLDSTRCGDGSSGPALGLRSLRAHARLRGTTVPMNRVVLFGGQKQAASTLCDLYSWSGNDWVKINATNQGPCVHSASMAWDTRSAASPRLIVANGFVDVNDTHNIDVWYFTFNSATSGTWTPASPSPCAPRREAMGALDLPSKKMVFFGGSSAPANSFNDTLVCL